MSIRPAADIGNQLFLAFVTRISTIVSSEHNVKNDVLEDGALVLFMEGEAKLLYPKDPSATNYVKLKDLVEILKILDVLTMESGVWFQNRPDLLKVFYYLEINGRIKFIGVVPYPSR